MRRTTGLKWGVGHDRLDGGSRDCDRSGGSHHRLRSWATLWMAHKTSDAAQATQRDADASRQAAEASLRSAVATEESASLARRGQDLGIRPLLADPRPAPPGAPDEQVQFGAPGRPVITMPAGSFSVERSESSFRLSVPFENVGAGVAVVQEAGWSLVEWAI